MTDLHVRGLEVPKALDLRAWSAELFWSFSRSAQALPLPPLYLVPLASFAGAFLGCLATLYLSQFGVPAALASATATLLICIVLIAAPSRKLVPATFASSAYGGSFAGMTPVAMLSDSVAPFGLSAETSFLVLSAFCGVMFLAFCTIEIRLRIVLLRGYGGRFGALAAVASFVLLSLAPMLGNGGEPVRLIGMDGFDQGLGGTFVIFELCVTGMIATMIMQRLPGMVTAARAARIFVSATVAFIGLFALQLMRPDDLPVADAYYSGCFLGMSSPHRLRGVLQPLLAAATLTALLVKASAILPSVGGSLGLAAFLSVAGVDMVSRLFRGLIVSPDHSTVVLRARALACGLTAMGVLLPGDVLQTQQAREDTGAIIMSAETAVAAPAAAPVPAPEQPAVETSALVAQVTASADPVPPVEAKPDVVAPVIPPPRGELPRPRRTRPPATVLTRVPAGSEPWSIIRTGAPERPARVAAPRPAAAKRSPAPRPANAVSLSSRPAPSAADMPR